MSAIVIQTAVRRYIHQRFYVALKQAAITIARAWRSAVNWHMTEVSDVRRKFESVSYGQQATAYAIACSFERKWTAASAIQRCWRGYRAQQRAAERKAYITAMKESAMRIQLAWYKRNRLFPTFLLMRCLYTVHTHDVQRREEVSTAVLFLQALLTALRAGKALAAQERCQSSCAVVANHALAAALARLEPMGCACHAHPKLVERHRSSPAIE